MNQWLASLQPRERVMVVVGAIAVIITLLYLVVWEPLQIGHQQALDDIDRKSSLVSQARTVLPAGRPVSSGPGDTQTSDQSLTSLIVKTVTSSGLASAYKSSSPSGNDGLRVSLENASFDAIVGWLGVLESQHGIAVDASSVTRRPQDGRVDASIVVRQLR
ncbi:MAG: type II secretion system protein GspM [Woeseiaceae bacterium]